MGQPNKINEKQKHTQIMKTKNKGKRKLWSVAQDKSNSTKGKTKTTFSLKQLELLHLNITLNTSTTE